MRVRICDSRRASVRRLFLFLPYETQFHRPIGQGQTKAFDVRIPRKQFRLYVCDLA
jgi:hypothetical protein